MIREIWTNKFCDKDFASEIIPTFEPFPFDRKKGYKAKSLYISWDNAIGDLSAQIEIYGIGADSFQSLGYTINVNKQTSRPDDWIIKLDDVCESLRINFVKNGCTSIIINSVIEYEEI